MKSMMLYRAFGLAIACLLGACAVGGGVAATPASTAQLADSRWRATSIASADGAAAAVPSGVLIDLSFDATATRASGSAGCNRFSAAATVGSGRLAFGPAAASKRMCGDPPDVMAVEARFLAALATVAQASIDGDRLELRSADGALVVALARAAVD